ncbi:MAG TPA: hypothetical protein VIY48_17800, partial [Candidatus Paceibacterota bacterium]
MDVGTLSLGGALSPITRVRRLFTAGEKGVWYDPSDIGTLFQDSAGTTPVTAVTQPVGLMLDKSKGLVLGPELVTNGTFDSAVGWTENYDGANGWRIVGGVAEHVGTLNTYLTSSYPLTIGKFYKLTCTVTGVVKVESANTGVISLLSGTNTYIFSATTAFLRFYANAAGTIDNVSFKELPGYHATQVTSTARPTLQQDANGKFYLKFDGVDDFMVTPSIDFSGTDKMSVFAGVRKLSDAAVAILIESSIDSNTNNGSFSVTSPATVSGNYGFALHGDTAVIGRIATTFNAPITNVITGQYNIGGADYLTEVLARINGVVPTLSSSGASGAGNF